MGSKARKTSKRYACDVRWTGVLQQILGNDYYVIEEGLSSRTTNIDYAKKPGRNGHTYLEPCLDSHAPLDYVILMLGTNDYKIEFNRSVEEIAQATKELVEIIKTKTAKYNGSPAKVVLVSPILVEGENSRLKEWYSEHYDESSVKKSQDLAPLLEALAHDTDCFFVDAAQVAKAGQDGIHFDEASHQSLGELLAKRLKQVAI